MNMRAFIPLAALIAIFNTPLLLAGNVPGSAVPITPVQPAASAPQPVVQPAQTSRNVTPEAVPQRDITWLGIAPGHVPRALFDQLKQIIPPGQGVLVKNVIPDSPAARAGIRTNDVLLAYGNQKLYSAQQLAGLVRADRPESSPSTIRSMKPAGGWKKPSGTWGASARFQRSKSATWKRPIGPNPGNSITSQF